MLKIGISTSIKISNTASTSYHTAISGSSKENNSGVGYNGLYGEQSGNSSGASGSISIVSQQSSIDNPLGNTMQPNTITLANSLLMVNSTMNSNNNISSTDSIGSALSSGNSGASSVGLSLQYQSSPNQINTAQALSSTLDSTISSNIIQSMNQTIFSSLCFHPKLPRIYGAIRNEIHVFDLLSQSEIARISIETHEIIKHLQWIVNTNGTIVIVCITDVGVVYFWDTESHKLLTIVHQLKAMDTRPLTCKSTSKSKPLIFFSKLNSKDIVVIDCTSKSEMQYKLKGHKKPISSLANHPSKNILASVSTDGQLKIWDIRNSMAIYTFEDFSSYENSRNIEHSNNYFLTFEPQGKYLMMVGSSGLTLVYPELTGQNPQDIIASGFICKGSQILSVVHHPHLPLVLVLSRNQQGIEELSSWEINFQQKSLVTSTAIPVFVPESNESLRYLSKYNKPLTVPKLTPNEIIVHPIRNYITFQWEVSTTVSESISPISSQPNTQSFSQIRHIYQNIYSINSYDQLSYSFPLVSPIHLPMGFMLQPESTFNYPSEVMFFDGSYVKAYHPLNGSTKKLIDQAIINGNNQSDEISKPKKFLYNEEFQLFTLIYFSYSISTQTQLSKYLIMDLHGSVNQQGDGVDSVMIGSSQILVLGLDGKLAKVASISKQGISSFKNHTLTPRVTSVHSTPLQDGKVVMYFCWERHCVFYSKNISPDAKDNYAVELNGQEHGILQLYPTEKVYKIEWQSDPKSNQNICAVMTDQRIIMTNQKLMIINQTQVPPQHRTNPQYFTSIFWLEWTLLYTTATQLMYMTLQYNLPPRPISSLAFSQCILASVLPDRIIYGYQGNSVPGRLETTVRTQAVGILEALIIGLLSLPPFISYEKKFVSSCLQNLVSKLDYSRCTKFLLDKLRERSFTDLAYSLANQMKPCQSKQSAFDKFRLAWSSKQYEDANKHLNEEYARLQASVGSWKSNSDQQQDKSLLNKLKDLMKDFSRECMNAGHYNLAREGFQKLGDYVYLVQIAVLLNDRDSIQQLRKELSENPVKSDNMLIQACDKFLQSSKQRLSQSKLNPPVSKILPWEPTKGMNVSVKVGLDYLAPINLLSIEKYFPIVGQFSGSSISQNGQRHKLRTPDEQWPPVDYKHSVTLAPPRTLMTLVANKLSTKSHISTTQTLRRSPSAENLNKAIKDYPKMAVGASQDFDFDSDDSDDSESGANADVDSENEDDLNQVTKTMENQLKDQLNTIDPEETNDSSEINSTELESELNEMNLNTSNNSSISNNNSTPPN
ncbi:WD40 repeat-containing protein [Tieghemostelium lacteum]|uniref:WD40 repeat-containing protein n=1 Tax=Tieghemostelium lacteum TaxID=361077 RepID=A0A151ZHA4_TIELA|nr:WD40 repeat-containing protein [Tieghemostelium lacteum]|eukprot:KYQ93244.1 WD40 repeat-containing protein [Tieghemostelium lacteum]